MILIAEEDTEGDSWKHAKARSKESVCRFKMGAAVIKRGKVLSSAPNSRKTHRRFGVGRFCTLHAETHAIYRAINRGHDVTGATVYVFRRHGTLARPCPDCQAIMKQHKIREVRYSNG